MLSKPKSMIPINNAKIKEATNTSTELLCRSDHFGQLTLCLISSTDDVTKVFNLLIDILLFLFARAVRFELTTLGFGDQCSTS